MLLPTYKLLSSSVLLLAYGLGIAPTRAQLHPTEPSQYQRLPPLRERAKLQDAWRAERLANVPSLLKKYEVDAWLVRHSVRSIELVHQADTSTYLYIVVVSYDVTLCR